jgi:gliding motility-associated-like protein
VPQLPNLQTCDTAAADGFAAFDLTSQDAALLQGQPTGTVVTYFTDPTFTSAIVTPALFTNTVNPQTIYVVVSTATGCTNTTSFILEVTPAIQLPVVPNLTLCDTDAPDGFTNFDLSTQDTALLQGLPASTVAYYTSQADAQGGVNAIAAPNSFVNTQNPQTIYAVVTNTTTGCTGTASFLLQVTPVPTVPLVPGLESCDSGVQDGVANFDLTLHTDALLQGQPGYTVTYFTTLADAEANTNAIAAPTTFNNSVNPQNIYARISNGTCYAVTGFDVTVLPTPQIGGTLQITGCPPFNLPAVVSGSGLSFTYYSTEADATAQTNAIASPAAYVNANGSTTVYVRGESAEGCEAFAEITLDTGDCNIPKGISPNNDGMNDAFDISFLDVQKLSVFNRYGMEVYALSNYTNQWYGQQDNGKELPTGTYYYVIEFTAGNSKTGWVYINRQVN